MMKLDKTQGQILAMGLSNFMLRHGFKRDEVDEFRNELRLPATVGTTLVRGRSILFTQEPEIIERLNEALTQYGLHIDMPLMPASDEEWELYRHMPVANLFNGTIPQVERDCLNTANIRMLHDFRDTCLLTTSYLDPLKRFWPKLYPFGIYIG
jgi:hypothetical protein